VIPSATVKCVRCDVVVRYDTEHVCGVDAELTRLRGALAEAEGRVPDPDGLDDPAEVQLGQYEWELRDAAKAIGCDYHELDLHLGHYIRSRLNAWHQSARRWRERAQEHERCIESERAIARAQLAQLRGLIDTAERERDDLQQQLDHLVSQAGPDSCADMARRCNDAERERDEALGRADGLLRVLRGAADRGCVLAGVDDCELSSWQTVDEYCGACYARAHLPGADDIEIIHTPCGRRVEECFCADAPVTPVGPRSVPDDATTPAREEER